MNKKVSGLSWCLWTSESPGTLGEELPATGVYLAESRPLNDPRNHWRSQRKLACVTSSTLRCFKNYSLKVKIETHSILTQNIFKKHNFPKQEYVLRRVALFHVLHVSLAGLDSAFRLLSCVFEAVTQIHSWEREGYFFI